MPNIQRSRRHQDFPWIVKADSTTNLMARQKSSVKRTTNYLKIQEIFQLDNQKAVNFYASVVRAEQLSNTIWNLTVADRTGVIRCTCHEGSINNGEIKTIPFEKGLFIRVHQAEIINDSDELQLNMKIGEAGCQIVLWDQFSQDADNALFFSSKRFTKNKETDQEMLQQNLAILAEYLVKDAMKNSLPFVTVFEEIEKLKNTSRGDTFKSRFFYEVDSDFEPKIEYYTKCDCGPLNMYLRLTEFQRSQCSRCGMSSPKKKTVHVKMKTLQGYNIFFDVPIENSEQSIPQNVSILASRATVIGIIHDNKSYELYVEECEYRPLTQST